MYAQIFPVIDLVATGENIQRMRLERGLSVRDLQAYFGFEEPRAIYKWQRGRRFRLSIICTRLENFLRFPWIRS